MKTPSFSTLTSASNEQPGGKAPAQWVPSLIPLSPMRTDEPRHLLLRPLEAVGGPQNFLFGKTTEKEAQMAWKQLLPADKGFTEPACQG